MSEVRCNRVLAIPLAAFLLLVLASAGPGSAQNVDNGSFDDRDPANPPNPASSELPPEWSSTSFSPDWLQAPAGSNNYYPSGIPASSDGGPFVGMMGFNGTYAGSDGEGIAQQITGFTPGQRVTISFEQINIHITDPTGDDGYFEVTLFGVKKRSPTMSKDSGKWTKAELTFEATAAAARLVIAARDDRQGNGEGDLFRDGPYLGIDGISITEPAPASAVISATWVHGNVVMMRYPGGKGRTSTPDHVLDGVIDNSIGRNHKVEWSDVVGLPGPGRRSLVAPGQPPGYRTGWGKRFRGKKGTRNFFLAPVPVRIRDDGSRNGIPVLIDWVRFFFVSDRGVSIQSVEAYDAAGVVFEVNRIDVSGSFRASRPLGSSAKPGYNHFDQSHNLVLESPLRIETGLTVLFDVYFEEEGEIEFQSIGVKMSPASGTVRTPG